jgi:DNA-binding HxlR family transcriptional regulator
MPLRSDWTGESCPIARSLEVLGDPWVMLVLRQAFSGVRRFEQLRDQLGVAENVLSKRLSTMVDAGLLRRVPYQDRRRIRHEYVLTEAGADTFPIVIDHTRTRGSGWTSSTAAADTRPPLRTSAVTAASA